MELFDSLDKRKLYAVTIFVSMIGGGCYLGFRGPRESSEENFGRKIPRDGVIIKVDSTFFGDTSAKNCLVNYIYRGDVKTFYPIGADTLEIRSCRVPKSN